MLHPEYLISSVVFLVSLGWIILILVFRALRVTPKRRLLKVVSSTHNQRLLYMLLAMALTTLCFRLIASELEYSDTLDEALQRVADCNRVEVRAWLHPGPHFYEYTATVQGQSDVRELLDLLSKQRYCLTATGVDSRLMSMVGTSFVFYDDHVTPLVIALFDPATLRVGVPDPNGDVLLWDDYWSLNRQLRADLHRVVEDIAEKQSKKRIY